MDKIDRVNIEKEVRRLQEEVYARRDVRYQLGVPDIPTIFDPRNVADFLELFYEERDRLDTDFPGGGEAVGIWRRDRSTILVSRRFSYETRRFTAGHEIGHSILHPHIGDRTLHREFPAEGARVYRPREEQEADHFAACLLMPRNAVFREFIARFSKNPLVLTETVAFHLKVEAGILFSQPRGSLAFAEAVATAQNFDRRHFVSLSKYFGVGPRAMAIRLDELGLVGAYLHA